MFSTSVHRLWYFLSFWKYSVVTLLTAAHRCMLLVFQFSRGNHQVILIKDPLEHFTYCLGLFTFILIFILLSRMLIFVTI